MADVMERLSAANPVPECSPLSIDHVWRRLEETSTADEPLAKGTTAGAHRWRRRRRPDLALVAVGLSVLVVVAMVVGAFALLHYRGATEESSAAFSGPFSQGQPNPTGPISPGLFDGIVKAGDSRILPIKVPDLQGGPPWGLRLVRTTRGETCVQLGRVQNGRLGSLGIADAWNNDHKFHAIPPSAMAAMDCGATDAVGHGFVNSGILGGSDSASLGGGGFGARPPGYSLSGPAASGCKLAGSGGPAPASWPTCPAGSNRIIFYGLLGPDAVSVTYRTPSGGLATEPTVGGVGAYLLVFPYNDKTCAEYDRAAGTSRPCNGDIGSTTPGPMLPGAITEVSYTHGRSCELSGRTQLCPAVGWVPFKVKHVSREEVATAIHVRIFPAGTYGCPNNLGLGCDGILGQSPSRKVPIQLTFTARVAVTNSSTSYSWNLQPPRYGNVCGPGDESGATPSNIRAGQTIRYSTFLPASCHGTYRLTVQFNAQTPNAPSGSSGPEPSDSIPVGEASFTIR